MPHPLTQWKKEFLARRGFSQPTGQPLYSYRMTSAEFDELLGMLREMTLETLRVARLSLIAQRIPFFPSLFVIYAAEWWRRRYDGSGWSWEPILDSLNAPADGWNQAQRSECIETGLREWRLRLSDIHGFRFLGSIAYQGGLPMQLLASARGSVGRVLGRVLRLASTGSVEVNDVQEWIRSLSAYLPQAYRQNEIYVLLAEVVLTVLSLKREANLTSAVGAIEALDRHKQGWRSRFPVPIDDSQTQSLIEQLIRDAADTPLVRRGKRISVERRLELLEDGTWQIRSDVDLAEYIDTPTLAIMFGAEETSLTRWLTLRFVRGDRPVEVGLRRLAGQDRYRIDRRPLECGIPAALAEHTMTLASPEGRIWNSSVARGEPLDLHLPWVFGVVGDTTQSFQFVRQGSGSVGSQEARVSIPPNWTINAEQDSEAARLGTLISGNREIWCTRGTVRLVDTDGRVFRIRCGQADAHDEQLEWRGSRLWELPSRPELAYRGVPTLYRVSEEGVAQAVASISWNISRGMNTRTPGGLVGPVDAIWPAEGDTKWRSRLLLLPDQARFRLEPGATPSEGAIRFSNWSLVAIQVESAEIHAQTKREGADFLLTLKFTGPGSPPEWCDLKLYWTGNPNEGRVRIPFPAKGVRALNAAGALVPNGSIVSVRRILGIRLVGFLGSSTKAELSLHLERNESGNTSLSSIRKAIATSAGETRIEIRLIDYEQDIQRLLSDADGLDAVVNVQLRVGFDSAAWLRIARYACELEPVSLLSGVCLPGHIAAQLAMEQVDELPVRAIQIDAPGEEPVSLPFVHASEHAAAHWKFPTQDLSSGPWLIYPGAESSLAFRPLLWPFLSETVEPQVPTGKLGEALRVTDESQRNDRLDKLIEQLALDFLDDDWTFLERLAGHLGHLPLSTLSIWRRFIRSTKGMAALALRLGTWPAGLIERFSTELPFMWEMVPIGLWGQAMWRLKDQCTALYGADGGKTVLSSHLDRRVRDMAATTPSLRIMLDVTKAAITGETNAEIRLGRQAFMDMHFSKMLFDGPDCRLQHLLRNNAEAIWPPGFDSELNRARGDRRARYLCSGRYDFRDAAINVPILLALESVMGLPPDRHIGAAGAGVGALRSFQTFDPEWFTEAFDLTVGRCLATNAIQLE